jgi:hypothetical protein
MAQNRETREVQNPALLATGKHPDVLCWRQQVGLFRAYDDPRRVVKVGQAGMADSGMIVPVTITPDMVGQTIGVAVQPEFKVPKGGRQKGDQKTWQKAVERAAGVYRLIRSADEMHQLIADVRSGKAWRR